MGHNCAIVLAGGRGKRMGTSVPKQYARVNGYPLIYYSLKAFEECGFIDETVLVALEDDIDYCREEIVMRYGFGKVKNIVPGGKERYESVYNGLSVAEEGGYIFVHDGARPCINPKILQKLYDDVKNYKASAAAVLSKDTVKISDSGAFVCDTPDRGRVWIVQTPQVFAVDELKAAYNAMMKDGGRTAVTDDASVMERYGKRRVHLCEASYTNIKVTTPEDLLTVSNFLQKNSAN